MSSRNRLILSMLVGGSWSVVEKAACQQPGTVRWHVWIGQDWKTMKTMHYIILTSFILLFVAAPSATAYLYLTGDANFGPNSITVDTSTGLGWLNVTKTTGLSYQQVLSETQTSGMFSGFRFATVQEVLRLYGSAGLAASSYGDTTHYYPVSSPSIQTFFSLIGTSGTINGLPGIQALSGSGWRGSSNLLYAPSIYGWSYAQEYWVSDGGFQDGGTLYGSTFSAPALSSWLVKRVIPVQAPTITCPEPLTLECTNGSAVGTAQVEVLDTNGLPLEVVWMVDGVASQTNAIPSGGSITQSNVTFTANFGDGEHTVVVSVSNGQTAPASCSTTVTVSDTLPPTVLAISATPVLLWPPNHRIVPVIVNVNAIDNCDSLPTAKITQITCNEPQGHFAPDWMITGPLSVDLRAERLGNHDRIYTIYVTVADSSGNTTATTTTVTVPASLSGLHKFKESSTR